MTKNFLIITHVKHGFIEGKFSAYAPYVNEMNLWFNHVERVEVCAPHCKAREAVVEVTYEHNEIAFTRIPSFNILSLSATLNAIIKVPVIGMKLIKLMKRSDHIHLRCPGNIGLMASVIQIFFPLKSKTVKYAGNWDPNAKQPRSYRFQKWILSNTFLSRNLKVLVYGDWPNQSKNILPFFTASFSETEKGLYEKDFSSPFKFIFVGSLSPGKRPLLAIQLIEAMIRKGIPVKLNIYGSGVLKNELQEYIDFNNLDPFVKLMGIRKQEELKDVYKSSHFLILASQSEGWPKAIAEAMFYGCIPIATPVSCVPWMLDYGKRGIVISHSEVLRLENKVNEKESGEDLTNRIINLIEDSDEIKRKSIAGQEWSQEYTMERFEKEIKKLLISNEAKS